MKKWVILLALASILIAIYRIDDRARDGFTLSRIAPTFADDPRWDIAVTPEEITRANEALNQPYKYLGHGFQCYVFVSQDDNYVLKFIRQQRLQPPVLYELLPLTSWRQEKVQAGKKRADYLFCSLKVAFEDVPDETGLLFVHLNKTKNRHPVVSIVDKAGTSYQVALDAHEFVLQRKASPIKETLAQLMQEGNVDLAKQRIDQIFMLLKTCAKKGIADMDTQLIRKNNLGFLPDSCIYVDTGKITRKESMKSPERFKKDLERLDPLYDWLKTHYPELAAYFLHENRFL